jgi:DNA primase
MSQVQQVKDAINIVDVIGERIKVKRAGSSFKALCPFHSESTPSFFINEQFQRYRCFGCGESGDALEFLQQFEGLTFAEALEDLANKAGIKLEKYHKSSADLERERLLEILHLAKEYYHYLLTKHKVGQTARDYLKNRGITNDSIKLFQIGYALDDWDGLLKYLTVKKKYLKDEVLKAGLVIKTRTGRYYDRFRGRVMFPLQNHRGQVVGFSGRLLDKKPKEAKYINTPETALYHKSQMLFGYSELYREIKKKNEVIVCEGEFDVISSVQAHVNHIVAIKGSALTEEQIKILERVADKVLLSLDTDLAGIKATKRAIQLMKDSRVELRVINLSAVGVGGSLKYSDENQVAKYKDADELASSNPKLWRETAKNSISVYDYLINVVTAKNDPSTPGGKRTIMDELAPIIASISHSVEQDFYVKKLAKILNVRPNLVQADIEKFGQGKQVGASTNSSVSRRSASSTQKPSASRQTPAPKFTSSEVSAHLLDLEKYLLFLTFHSSETSIKDKARTLSELKFVLPSANALVKSLNQFKPVFDLKKFASFLPEDLKASIMDIYLDPKFIKVLPSIKPAKEWQTAYDKVFNLNLKYQMQIINQEIETLDGKNEMTESEDKRMNELLIELSKLQHKLKH